LYKVRAWLAIAELRALSAKWRERRELVAWCEERRGHGVIYIGGSASTMKETNQAPTWLRYIGDQRDAREDWGLAEQRVVQPHHGCAHTPSSSPSSNFSSRFTYVHGDSRDAGVGFLFTRINK
jgi:hypothetical protein